MTLAGSATVAEGGYAVERSLFIDFHQMLNGISSTKFALWSIRAKRRAQIAVKEVEVYDFAGRSWEVLKS